MRKLAITTAGDNDIDMTPMLDIVFIMLIFFIVTSSFMKESALSFARPTSSEGPRGPVSAITLLELTADNRILNQGRERDLAVVPALLEQQLSREPASAVLIQAHPDSNTELMLQLVDAAKRAGIVQISVGSYAAG